MMALVMMKTIVVCNVYVSVDDNDNDFGVYWRILNDDGFGLGGDEY